MSDMCLNACRIAIDPTQLTNVTALDAQLPVVDAIIATSPSNNSKVLTFSSATDPGNPPPPTPLHRIFIV